MTGGSRKSQSPTLCDHCGRYHFGRCRAITGACFSCDTTDHFVRDCPITGGRPKRSEKSISHNQKGRYHGNERSSGVNHPGVSEATSNRDFKTSSRVCHIHIDDDKDAPYIVKVLSNFMIIMYLH
ncbi:hypothetical protein V6N13_061367 [Hibiscus sabdariffa]